VDTQHLTVRKIFTGDKQLVVPLYQRPYVWSRKDQWQPLWDDILLLVRRVTNEQTPYPHFMGAVVLDQMDSSTSSLERRLIIDGQQRLTTIQLLLEAVADLCEAEPNDGEDGEKRLRKLTRNDDVEVKASEDAYKVWPTAVDQAHFRAVMEAATPEDARKKLGVGAGIEELGNDIGNAYIFFYETAREWLVQEPDRKAALEALVTVLRDYLSFVVIDLGPKDDAQVIFETLNARGTPLLPGDLIKNTLLQELRKAKANVDHHYTKYWRQFDKEPEYWRARIGKGHAQRARLDNFLQQYLTLRILDDVSVTHLYATFKQTLLRHGEPSETKEAKGSAIAKRPADELLKEIAEYATIFRSFDSQPEGSRAGIFLGRLAAMEMFTVYPFLLQLFSTVDPKSKDCEATLTHIESYLVRRMVCGLSARGYNRIFLDLVQATAGLKTNFADTVAKFLLKSDADFARWPTDADFKSEWMSRKVYQNLTRRRTLMLLEALEAKLRASPKTEGIEPFLAIAATLKVPGPDDKPSQRLPVEHIMPRKWRKHWDLPVSKADEGDAEQLRDALIHTVGNLTLVTKALNSSMSNQAWTKKGEPKKGKRKALADHTTLMLNKSLIEMDRWDDDAIKERGLQTFKLALKIWPRAEP